jgi:hypothetical protein
MTSGEVRRQQSLIAALWSPDAAALARAASGLPCQSQPVPVLRGLQAYRGNAQAHAARALKSAYPTVDALVGADDFAHLAAAHWLACPPQRGDLAQWGAGLGDWLEQHPQLSGWPYLGDCARLDWACHVAASAADARLDADSLALLSDTDPAHLRLVLRPGLAIVTSAWPVASIHAAHAHIEGSAERDRALDAARMAIHEQRAENALVSRNGSKVSVAAADAATARWTRELLAGRTLAAALDAVVCDGNLHGNDTVEPGEANDAGFDFGSWLAMAITSGWLHRVVDVVGGVDGGLCAHGEARQRNSVND